MICIAERVAFQATRKTIMYICFVLFLLFLICFNPIFVFSSPSPVTLLISSSFVLLAAWCVFRHKVRSGLVPPRWARCWFVPHAQFGRSCAPFCSTFYGFLWWKYDFLRQSHQLDVEPHTMHTRGKGFTSSRCKWYKTSTGFLLRKVGGYRPRYFYMPNDNIKILVFFMSCFLA